jgi:hypothetical protein
MELFNSSGPVAEGRAGDEENREEGRAGHSGPHFFAGLHPFYRDDAPGGRLPMVTIDHLVDDLSRIVYA